MGILWFPSWKSKCSWNSGIRIWTERGRILPPDSIWKLREYVGSDQENWEYLIENLAAGTGVGSRCGFGGGFWRVTGCSMKEKGKVWHRTHSTGNLMISRFRSPRISYLKYETWSRFPPSFSWTAPNTPSYTAKSTPWSDALGAADNMKTIPGFEFYLSVMCVNLKTKSFITYKSE